MAKRLKKATLVPKSHNKNTSRSASHTHTNTDHDNQGEASTTHDNPTSFSAIATNNDLALADTAPVTTPDPAPESASITTSDSTTESANSSTPADIIEESTSFTPTPTTSTLKEDMEPPDLDTTRTTTSEENTGEESINSAITEVSAPDNTSTETCDSDNSTGSTPDFTEIVITEIVPETGDSNNSTPDPFKPVAPDEISDPNNSTSDTTEDTATDDISDADTAAIDLTQPTTTEDISNANTAAINLTQITDSEGMAAPTDDATSPSDTPDPIDTQVTQPTSTLTSDEQARRQHWLTTLVASITRHPLLARPTRPESRERKKVSRKVKITLVVLLVILLLPTITTIIEGLRVYSLYSHAQMGVLHLLNIKTIFTGAQAHPTGFLDVAKLDQAQRELQASQNEFKFLETHLTTDADINFANRFFPSQVNSAHELCKIGLDITDIGQKLVQSAKTLAPTFRGSLLADSSKPLVTQSMLDLVRDTIDYLLPRLNDIQTRSGQVKLDDLPIGDSQRQQLTQLFQLLPQAQTDLTQVRNLIGSMGWLLGVNEPRTLLVQTMDRAELRPTGGFTGQFGELVIKGGRVAPFTLKNIGPFEEGATALPVVQGALPPAKFNWWPIPNWGLRDSNLSADFPTSAKLAIQAYKKEFHRQVDGVVLFSPFLIAHVLQITGPITIPEYHETITAQNLEERLHYYQLDNDGIRKEEIVEKEENPDAARKLFTARLARVLTDHVRHAPPDELITIAHELLSDLKTKDLQVYVTNPQLQALLSNYGLASEMDRSKTHDGLYVVQANLSASKASQYVHTTLQDTVNLDSKGGATHTLHMRLAYNQIGPVYGLDTYRDYIRVYVPPTAQLLRGNGFDSGTPFCGAGYQSCPPNDIYGDGTLLCPLGTTDAGYSTDMLHDSFFRSLHPIDAVGGPTNVQSDESGRKMFGGWAVIPKNCSLTITLSWYVPPIGQSSYSLLVQRQSSTLPELDLTI
ncbi:MAG: DUF4012 domain-containing protein, partial [Ktedonobacteraceae bacterium]|nr:DUF4012 domain-containing protein [Ktedonobacteraceae bacterium]